MSVGRTAALVSALYLASAIAQPTGGKLAEASDLGLTVAPEKLVLITPTPLGREVGDDSIRDYLLAPTKTNEDADEFIRTHSGLPLTPRAHAHERTIQDYLHASRGAWEAWLWHGVEEDWIDRCSPVDTDTLLIAALQDPVWGPDMQQELTMPHLSRAQMERIDTGHLVPLEAPDQLAAMLHQFAGR